MGKTEDQQRAARARERAKEERAEAEAEAAERELRARNAREKTATLLAASCHPLWWFGSEDFSIWVGVLSVLAFGVGVSFLIMPQPALPRDVSLGVAGVAVVCAAVGLGIRASVRARMNAAWDLEAAWLAKLPFKVDGIDGGLASTSSDHRLRVRITFQVRNEMPLPKAREMLVHVDPGGTASRAGERLELSARIAGDPEGGVARVKARRLLFHDLVDGVLLPLHVDAPIKSIELTD